MKKFIVFIITAIILAVTSTFTAKAQYAYGQPTQDEQGVSVEKPNLLLMPEYMSAQDKARKGQTLFWVGLGMQVVGGVGLALTPTEYTLWEVGEYGTYEHITYANRGMIIAKFIEGGLTIAGSVMEIVGLCKWINGSVAMRDMRFAYSLTNGGIVVAF